MKRFLSSLLVVFLLLSNSCAITGGGQRVLAQASEEVPPELKSVHLKLEGSVDADTVLPLMLALGILNEVAQNKPDFILLEIDSPGGEVDIGFQLAKAIEDSNIPVLCAVDGEAASMAFFILQSCHMRVATPRSKLMIHGVTIMAPVTQQNLPGLAQLIEVYNEMLIQHILPRLKLPEAEIRKKIAEGDWWMSATQGVEFGALDGLIEKV